MLFQDKNMNYPELFWVVVLDLVLKTSGSFYKECFQRIFGPHWKNFKRSMWNLKSDCLD